MVWGSWDDETSPCLCSSHFVGPGPEGFWFSWSIGHWIRWTGWSPTAPFLARLSGIPGVASGGECWCWHFSSFGEFTNSAQVPKSLNRTKEMWVFFFWGGVVCLFVCFLDQSKTQGREKLETGKWIIMLSQKCSENSHTIIVTWKMGEWSNISELR